MATTVEPLPQQPTSLIGVSTYTPQIPADTVVLEMATEVARQVVHHGFTTCDAECPKALIQELQFLTKPFTLGLYDRRQNNLGGYA